MNLKFLKISKQLPGETDNEADEQAILLRAYGNASDILIDREMEVTTHTLLAERDLAAPLLARFNNGLLYKYVPGRACTWNGLTKESVWQAIAMRFGEWHAQLPLQSGKMNFWTVLQGLISALSARSNDGIDRNTKLLLEFDRFHTELVNDDVSAIFATTQIPKRQSLIDLLSACSRSLRPLGCQCPSTSTCRHICSPFSRGESDVIDYEYASACPAAFDLANHFSEWGGTDCDYNMLPPRSTRRAFIEEYLQSCARFN